MPGGALLLHEPPLSEAQRLSSEADLRPLGEDIARRFREVDEEIYGDPGDPRMALRPEGLAALLEKAAWTEVFAERTLETIERRVGPEEVVRWFSMSSKRRDGPGSYEERLLGKLTRDEVAA